MGRAARLVDPRGGLTTPLRGEEMIITFVREANPAADPAGRLFRIKITNYYAAHLLNRTGRHA